MRFKMLGGTAVVLGAALAYSAEAPGEQASPPAPDAAQPATAPSTAPAGRPADTPQADAEIDRLVRQLGDPDWRRREKAQAELVQMGDRATAALERLVASADLDEARTAAQNALKQIAENRMVGPSLVTLRLKDVPARRAFDELAKQAFAPMKVYPEDLWRDSLANTRVSIDVDRQPFWTVMRELGRQTGLELRDFNGERRLMETGQTIGPRSVISGPFLVTANHIMRSQMVNLEMENPAVEDNFGIQLTLVAEPKLRVLSAATSVKLQEVVDENGNSLVPPDAPGADGEDLSGPVYGGEGSYSVYANLAYPKKNPGRRIARLRGSVGFEVQVESERLDVPAAKLRETSRTVKGIRLSFGGLTKQEDHWQLRITAAAPETSPAWQELQTQILMGLKLLDARGQQLEHRGIGSTGDDSSVEMTLSFGSSHRPEDGRESGEPVRMVWEIPTKTRDVTVPFEFEDLRLP